MAHLSPLPDGRDFTRLAPRPSPGGAPARGTPRAAALSFPKENRRPRVVRQARHPTPRWASAALGRPARAKAIDFPPPSPSRSSPERQTRLLRQPAFSRRKKEKGQWLTPDTRAIPTGNRSEEHTSELQSLMRNSYAVFCLKKKKKRNNKKREKRINT